MVAGCKSGVQANTSQDAISYARLGDLVVCQAADRMEGEAMKQNTDEGSTGFQHCTGRGRDAPQL